MTTLHKLHKARPLLQYQKSLKDMPLSDFAKMYRESKVQHYLKSKEGDVKSKPEVDAISFYLMNHGMALISQKYMEHEPLGPLASLVEQYHEVIGIKTIRMFYYLILICTRESRHAQNRTKLHQKYPKIAKFHGNLNSSSQAPEYWSQSPPEVTLGEYANFLVDVFTMCSYNGGYGGKKWAEVATPLREYVNGNITAEMMMDTAYTLAHNNGPIFNKGMLFHMYDGAEILRILDVQRAGMIPQLVASKGSPFVRPEHTKFQQTVEKALGASFGGTVDWLMVMKLGAKGNYHHLVAATKNGPGTKPQSKLALYKAKKKAVAEAAAKAKAAAEAAAKASEFEKNHIKIYPGVHLKKLSRKEAA